MVAGSVPAGGEWKEMAMLLPSHFPHIYICITAINYMRKVIGKLYLGGLMRLGIRISSCDQACRSCINYVIIIMHAPKSDLRRAMYPTFSCSPLHPVNPTFSRLARINPALYTFLVFDQFILFIGVNQTA